MRAWSTRLEGLQLRLPSGWYELAPHIAWSEVRRLAELLARGLPNIDHVVEIEAGVLDERVAKLALSRSVVVVRAPANAGEAQLEALKAQLSAVPLGLVQHEQPSAWPDVAWQERFVKGPLLSALERELRDETHPFAGLGIRSFPVDAIAKLTPEPIELLEIVEAAIDHRITYSAIGTDPEDWLRSALRAAAERVAGRLLSLPSALLRRAIDVILDTPGGSRSTIDDREASLALTHAGLAWSAGPDLLLSPLASFGLSTRAIGRLVLRLPEDAWSEAGRKVIHAVVPAYLPTLRVNLIAPEPPYATWPALVPVEVLDELQREVLEGFASGPRRELAMAEFGLLGARLREIESERSDAGRLRTDVQVLRPSTPSDDAWLELLEACNTALDELDDEPLVALDFERGGIRRFDRVDRLAGAIGASSPKLVALVRWRGMTPWLARVRLVSEIEMLTAQAELGLAGVEGDVRLALALRALVGDLWALQQRYRKALEWWELAGREGVGEQASRRLEMRILLGLARLDDPTVLDRFQSQPDDIKIVLPADLVNRRIFEILFAWMSRWIGRRIDFPSNLGPFKVDDVIAVASAIERHDWPMAARLVREDIDPGDSNRAKIVRAWVLASLDGLDEAALDLADIASASEGTYDALACALAKRGLALVALRRARTEEVLAKLEEALALEQGIEITDNLFLEFEVAIWKLRTGDKPDDVRSVFDAALEGYIRSTGNFANSLLADSLLRIVLSTPANLPRLNEVTLNWFLQNDIQFNPSLSLELVNAILAHESTSAEKHPRLLDLARKLAGGDAALLQQIERLAAPLPSPT